MVPRMAQDGLKDHPGDFLGWVKDGCGVGEFQDALGWVKDGLGWF